MDKKLLKIGDASKVLGVCTATLRLWEKTGELVPDRVTKGGTRFYNPLKLSGYNQIKHDKTICYARVSSSSQKDDLERQHSMLESYCSAKGWKSEMIKDLGSGMNYKKKGLNQLIDKILSKSFNRLVITHKDRLLRFGSELLFSMCEKQGIEVIVIHQSDQPTFEEELAQDVLEIITIFSARLYGSRSKKNKRLMDSLKDVISSQN